MMIPRTVTLIAARFDRDLAKGEDQSARPGAALFTAGSEIAWHSDGTPRRKRDIRLWQGIWDSADDADAYLDVRGNIALLSDAAEVWVMRATPYASHGVLNWSEDMDARSLFPDLGARPAKDAPILVMTSLHLTGGGEGALRFGRGTRAVREGFRAEASCLAELQLLHDFPLLDGPTFSVWETEGAAIKAAYRAEPHRSSMKIGEEEEVIAGGSFTRMALNRSEGSWGGVDLSALV